MIGSSLASACGGMMMGGMRSGDGRCRISLPLTMRACLKATLLNSIEAPIGLDGEIYGRDERES